MQRKIFGYISAKVYGGKSGDKAVGIHLKAKEKETLDLLDSPLHAIKYGKDIDITVFTYRQFRNGKKAVTVTSWL